MHVNRSSLKRGTEKLLTFGLLCFDLGGKVNRCHCEEAFAEKI